jgi:sodium-dependent dicarboxylate transporter 2/3/5
MLLLAPPEGMAILAWRTAAVGVLVATWWITEAVPIAATALLPIVPFPPRGVATVAATTAPYANPVILGGFPHRDGARELRAASAHGHRRPRGGGHATGQSHPPLMAATALIRMWVSNSATVVMMLPMATSVFALARGGGEPAGDAPSRAFDVALLLGQCQRPTASCHGPVAERLASRF